MENSIRLPAAITISKFAAARGREIQIMKKCLATTTSTKMAFQKLPKHMRRRAMSHNVKRLPRRLREIHKSQMTKSGLPPKQKRPSRKYRRRPYNLTSDYIRRQNKCKWLNTHIWHAKRFHMVEKWGYKLPHRPCDRAFRACYRATANHCLLQDISYFSCIELSGNYDTIISNFKFVTNKNTGLTFAAKSYSKGSREGSVMLFHHCDTENEPSKAIGLIYFSWSPTSGEFDTNRTVWLWVHAAFYKEALENLLKCFDLISNIKETENSKENPILSYCNKNNGIELKELRTELSRFRLTGPLSHAVLQNSLKLADLTNFNLEDKFGANVTKLTTNQSDCWNILKSVATATALSPHMILSLIIEDPRYNFPKKRTKSLPVNEEPPNVFLNLPDNVSDSPLWLEDVRKDVKNSKMSNTKINELRSNLLVPGSDLEEKGASVPVLLVQRPGKKSQELIGYGSGWDLIIPSAWAQPLWISLIMWGARAGGLREAKSITFEAGEPDFLHPDTLAGIQEEKYISNECKEIFFKKPPNKRVNYNKFSIASPFDWNWNLLLSDWKENKQPVEDYFVLRDNKILKSIQEYLNSKSNQMVLADFSQNCLIPVRLKLNQKGLCKQFSIICVPKDQDFKKEPEEPNRIDKLQIQRKEMRSSHKELLKRLRQRRRRAKKVGKMIPIDMELLVNYRNKMRQLWLPAATTIRNSCSREVMGFIRTGDFSFLLGKASAVGYVAIGALPTLLSSKFKNKVLVRNTDTKHYRLATLEIVLK